MRVEKEGGHKEGCIHKSLSLGIVVRDQGTEKKEERCVVCKSKEDGKEMDCKEGVTGNSEYAGLSSIACKQTEGRKAVKTVTETERLGSIPQASPLRVTKG